MMLSHWKAILESYRQVDDLLDRVVGPESPAEALSQRLSPDALESLAQQLTSKVERLRAALSVDLRSEDVEAALQPFVFLVDEKVLRRLDDADARSWPLLQLRMFGVDSGGDLFFEQVDASLRRAETQPLLFEMQHFCLTSGFTGRNVGYPARIRDYRERLAARIPKPEMQPVQAEDTSGIPPPTLYDFPWRYYAVTALIILLLPVLLWRLSN